MLGRFVFVADYRIARLTLAHRELSHGLQLHQPPEAVPSL
jgi:hypothetical protein